MALNRFIASGGVHSREYSSEPRRQNLRGLLFLLVLSISMSAHADQVIAQSYGAPFYDAAGCAPAAPTVAQAVSGWWACYKHVYGLPSNTSCGYTFTPLGGSVTNDFGDIGLTGLCRGGTHIMGRQSCPSGYKPVGAACETTSTNSSGNNVILPAKNFGSDCRLCSGDSDPTNNGSDPVNGATGNVFEIQSDYSGPGAFPLKIIRYYNSQSPDIGQFGSAWTGYYGRHLLLSGSFAVNGVTHRTLYAYRPNGRVETFDTTSTAAPYTFTSDPDVTDRVESTSNGYALYGSNGVDEGYDGNGKLIWLQPYGGLRQTLTYNASGGFYPVTADTSKKRHTVPKECS